MKIMAYIFTALSFISFNAEASSQSFLANQVIDVMSWNIQKVKQDLWHQDFLSLSQHSDLILLQEAYYSGAFYQTILKHDNFSWREAESFRMPDMSEGFVGTGVCTGANVEAIGHQVMPSDSVEPFIGSTKLSLLSYYPVDGVEQSLLVINTHAINFVTTQEFDHELWRLAQVIEKHSGPIIWAGDFNTWSMGRIDHLYMTAEDMGLTAVPFAEAARAHFFGLALDHAFYRGFQLVSSDRLDTISSSDHIPLRFRLRFN